MSLIQGGQWVDIIDHWSIIDHFAEMVDILQFVVDIALKWSIFHQNLSKVIDFPNYLKYDEFQDLKSVLLYSNVI